MNVPVFPWTPEYTPSAFACQTSTFASAIARHVDALTTVRWSASGVPGSPSVMFLRTASSGT